jgi:hypothetical protein
MLAATRPTTTRGRAKSAQGRGRAFAADSARRIGAFVLARPGTIALVLLFGGLGVAVSANALWMQSAHHPAPLFRQATLQPQHPARKVPEDQANPPASAASAEDAGAAILPPSRPTDLGRPAEPGAAAAAKPATGRRPTKDPIGDLLGGTAPVPPAPIKPSTAKGQPVEKSARPIQTHPDDAIATLIQQTARSH